MDQLVLDKSNAILLALRHASIHEDIVFPAVTMEIASEHHVATCLLKGSIGLSGGSYRHQILDE